MHPHNPNSALDELDDEPMGVGHVAALVVTGLAALVGLAVSVAQAFWG